MKRFSAARTLPSTVAMFAGVLSAATPAAHASTITCLFGDSTGVGLRNGTWEHGKKPGSQSIVYRRDGHVARGTRQADGDAAIGAVIVVSGDSVSQFIATWSVASASVVEVTTMESKDRVISAVRTIQTAGGFGGASAMIDHGRCEVRP